MIRNGVTTFADTYSGPSSISGSLDSIVKALSEAKIRGYISFEATQRNSDEEGWKGLKENESLAKKHPDRSPDSCIQAMSCVHASFTVKDDLLTAGRELANKYGIPFTIHTSEGGVDLYHNYKNYNERTVERLKRTGVLTVPDGSMPSLLAHCVHLNHDEIDLIATSPGVTVG